MKPLRSILTTSLLSAAAAAAVAGTVIRDGPTGGDESKHPPSVEYGEVTPGKCSKNWIAPLPLSPIGDQSRLRYCTRARYCGDHSTRSDLVQNNQLVLRNACLQTKAVWNTCAQCDGACNTGYRCVPDLADANPPPLPYKCAFTSAPDTDADCGAKNIALRNSYKPDANGVYPPAYYIDRWGYCDCEYDTKDKKQYSIFCGCNCAKVSK